MLESYDSLRLALPSRKIPIGKVVVSEDNEILLIFKDSIGVFVPNSGVILDNGKDPSYQIGSKIKFFTYPGGTPKFPIRFTGSAVPPSLEVARYALTRCDRIALAMCTKTLETKDFLSHLFRNADWSPPGVDKFSRTVFSCVTGSHQLLVCARDAETWTCVANVSNCWNAFWQTEGLEFLAKGHQEFVKFSDSRPRKPQASDSSKPLPDSLLKCPTVQQFFSSLSEMSFMQSTWSNKVRQSKSKTTYHNCLLAALHKSGGISFWDVTVPLLEETNIRLSAIDRTYAAAFDPPQCKERPNFIKMFDMDSDNIFLIVGFTSSRVICVTYHAYPKLTGCMAVERKREVELCACSSALIPVGDVTYTSGVLAIAYGTRILIVSATNQKQFQVIANFTNDAILKNISGVRIFNNNLYTSSLDGIIARSPVPTQAERNPECLILTKASTLGDRNFHRFFGDLHITKNGIYAVFVESTFAPAFCNVTSNLMFLSLLSKKAVVEMAEAVNTPMRSNLDCLHEIVRLLCSSEFANLKSREQTSVDLDTDSWTQRLLLYQNKILGDSTDISKLELPKLQFRRAILVLLSRMSPVPPDIQCHLEPQLKRLDQILALRQIDRCYRLFLKTDVQRQAQDCVLVMQIARLCLQALDVDVVEGLKALALSNVLRKASEVVKVVAQKLLSKRFGKGDGVTNDTTLLACPVCRNELTPDLLRCVCSNGHQLPRCSTTFTPCVEPQFYECAFCRRCSVLLPENNPSQWRREVNSRFCPFCGIRFTVTVF